MCIGDKNNYNDPAPKPAQIPQYSPSSSKLPARASMPPSHNYAAPAGSPPSKNNPFFNNSNSNNNNDAFAPPPPGPPPPSFDAATRDPQGKQKQHDWESAVPDTALLPPPPNFFSGFDRSPANNATEEQAEAGEAWCREYALYPPLTLDAGALSALASGNINMFAPPSFRGALARTEPGVWRGSTPAGTPDTYLATYPPLYSAAAHSPLATARPKTAYFEVRILEDERRRPGKAGADEVTLALGFAAPPYPAFRLPGWHRASVGVHGDDGHKYINDRWGGKEFAAPFRRGETIGLGMDFTPAPQEGKGKGGIAVEIFLTRDGVERGRWNLHEETDREQDLPVAGLEGFHDLCAAVGVFESTAFEVVFAPGRWAWKGYRG